MLEDVALDGTATRHEPVSVTVVEPNAVGLAAFGAAAGAAAAGAGRAGARWRWQPSRVWGCGDGDGNRTG